jgi:hypothetical protein
MFETIDKLCQQAKDSNENPITVLANVLIRLFYVGLLSYADSKRIARLLDTIDTTVKYRKSTCNDTGTTRVHVLGKERRGNDRP